MRSYGSRVDSYTNMSGVLVRRESSQRRMQKGRRLREDSDWSDVAADQGTLKIAGNHQKIETMKQVFP